MARNILLFSDGTGNSAAKLVKTNVWRLYQAVDLSDPDRQIAYYDDGVGTSSFKPLAVLGGAFGWGLKRNVIDLYTFLCTNYREGDRIFCFGFSRGAFTVRVLTGLILNEGIVSADEHCSIRGRAKTAFREYKRKRYHSALKLEVIGRAIRDLFVSDKEYAKAHAAAPKPPITFLGVWDTVSAYGLPIDELTRALAFVWPLTPPDRDSSERALRVCHAVALDDERNTFHPMLFNEQKLPANQASRNISEERVTQVWFAGMHSNVGGGYPDDALSGVSLCWMMEQAKAHGLLVKKKQECDAHSDANPLGKLYDSRRGLGGFYRYLPRKMSLLTNDTFDKNKPCVINRPKIHESVFQRIAKGVDEYAPIGLPARYAVVDSSGNIVDNCPDEQAVKPGWMDPQEKVWNLVWFKRVMYFSSILVASALLAFPLWSEPAVDGDNWASFISPMIETVGIFLPDLAAPILDSYKGNPRTFLALVAAYCLLIWVGNRLQGSLSESMRRLWKPLIQDPASTAPRISTLVPADPIYRWRTSRLYLLFFQVMKRAVLPALFGFAAFWIMLGTTSRAVFKFGTSAGLVCQEQSGSLSFNVDSLCSDTGVEVEKGKRYRLMLRIDESAPWKDASIPTGVGGFDGEEMGWAHPLFAFFRRSFSERWFTPIARIGVHGNDEYPLHPVNGSVPDRNTRELVAEITARRNGPLFVFVNDAVLPVPNSWQRFYTNNKGRGTIAVEELQDLETGAAVRAAKK